MCQKLNDGVTKTCACKFAQLCKARHKSEILLEKLRTDLNKQPAFDTITPPLKFTQRGVNNQSFIISLSAR
jgi:hypothetical protein